MTIGVYAVLHEAAMLTAVILCSIYMASLGQHELVAVGSSRPPTKEDHSSVKPRTNIIMTKADLPDSGIDSYAIR
jgi:hypothetical protein